MTKATIGITGTIYARGNGLCTADSYVAGDDGNLYLVTNVGRAATSPQGLCAPVTATLADWSDVDEDSIEDVALVVGAE